MEKTFTPEEIAEAKWASNKAISIKTQARIGGRRSRFPMTEQEILNRVPEEEKERFLAGLALYKAGAYRP